MRELTQAVENSIAKRILPVDFLFEIEGSDYSAYLQDWTISFSKDFGASVATFVLNNEDGRFSDGGEFELKPGNLVSFTEIFNDMGFKKFYGELKNRSIVKINYKQISLVCYDYISTLQDLDIDVFLEGDKREITNEILDPIYLDEPNESLAQIFNFANDSIATIPSPVIQFQDTNSLDSVDTQFDGYQVIYDAGQLFLGTPLNVLNNYLVKVNYSHYTRGIPVEEAMETILIQPTQYGDYLFGETTQEDLINNHLTSTYSENRGTEPEQLLVNYGPETIKIEHQLTQDWLPNDSGFDSNLYLDSVEGLPIPESGENIECSINGDIFTYNYIGYDTLDGAYLSGIPTSGEYSLGDKYTGSYMVYEQTYGIAQVFYHAFNNHITTLIDSDYTLPTGREIKYIDKKFGRIILEEAGILSDVILCNSDYSFKTLQSTGININQINFRSRDTSDRLVAINQLRSYLAPNYLFRTIGDEKIWASYVRQKTVADWDLQLVRNVNYMEDVDLYTRVKFYRKNKQPTNIMFGDDVDYTSDDEDSYTGIAVQSELNYMGEEKSGLLSSWASNQLSEASLLNIDNTERVINYIKEVSIDKDYVNQSPTGYHVFATPVSGDVGKIILGSVVPTIYINGVPVDNKLHSMTGVACKVKQTTKTQTVQEISDGKAKSTSTRSYYYYEIVFAHTSISPDSPIYLYNNQGLLAYTLQPNDPNMNYNAGIWTIPGTERNDIAEVLSTASYQVLFADDAVVVDYDNAIFKINRNIMPNPLETDVRATYEYWAISINVKDIELVVDGRRNTQLQIEFFGEPPSGFHLATIDLGSVQRVQAVDLVAGFFKPDEFRKFDVNFQLQMQYSINGTDFYSISDETESIEMSGGQALPLEESALGSQLDARYLKFNILGVEKINYGRGRYVVAITEISVYNDIIIESDAKLIPTTYTTQELNLGESILYVENTKYFDIPETGEYGTAYLYGEEFTYTGLTETSFVDCIFQTGTTATSGTIVTKTLENSTDLYDYDGTLQNLGERTFKDTKLEDGNLFTQADLDYLSKSWLYEFVKEHTKLNTEVLYVPFLNVGDTIAITDEYNNLYQERYFIENLQNRKGFYTLTLGKYPE